LVLTVFDPDFARSVGIRTGVVDYALLGALSVAVVVSIQAVGVVLVSAMLIIPPSAALFVSKRMHRVVLTSGIIGAVSGFVGSFFSFIYEGVATGPSMVLAATAIFVVCLLFGPRGLLFRGAGRRSGGDDETMQSTTPESDPVAGSTV
jgi:manganese/zinc/iron transport system permease protein